ncbi:MAG: inositol monophosphatase [Syntrophaceae bacterium]|nr:inositol monophosphatase [Syntrophaceae bacterium]
MDSFGTFMTDIARQAGTWLKRRLDEEHTIDYKGVINIVTEADRQSEEMIVSAILDRYPDHDILAEERDRASKGSPCRWIIDPLDGTTNYAHGYPVFCVSIAFEENGIVQYGAVYNPMLEEMFYARRGEGAFLNGRPIRVSGVRDLSRSLLATGFPYDIRENADNNMDYFNIMARRAQAIRRAGSAALDMAYVAAGRFDGFWELRLMPWDTAAGWLLIIEAGGMVTSLSGGPFTFNAPHILASNGQIHESMIAALRLAAPPA